MELGKEILAILNDNKSYKYISELDKMNKLKEIFPEIEPMKEALSSFALLIASSRFLIAKSICSIGFSTLSKALLALPLIILPSLVKKLIDIHSLYYNLKFKP